MAKSERNGIGYVEPIGRYQNNHDVILATCSHQWYQLSDYWIFGSPNHSLIQ